MGKPRLIIVIRHAQSEGNKNRDIHQMIPDHRVKLTDEGWRQAEEAGRRLRTLLRPDDTLQIYTSPYRRTRETTEGILSTLTARQPSTITSTSNSTSTPANDNEDTPSPFSRGKIKVYEEPRLREQDFGNFQPCSAEMERMWQERADYGHFFYRIPNGESAADAYDRISGFNESLWRQFGEDDFPSVCVLVTHGLMTRVFLMKWYHWSVEYFEDLRNINHCEFILMQQNADNGKFALTNQLRTWSELKKQKAEEARVNEAKSNPQRRNTLSAFLSKQQQERSPKVLPRKWGGCVGGCDHQHEQYPRRKEKALAGVSDVSLPPPAVVEEQMPGDGSSEADDHTVPPSGTALAPKPLSLDGTPDPQPAGRLHSQQQSNLPSRPAVSHAVPTYLQAGHEVDAGASTPHEMSDEEEYFGNHTHSDHTGTSSDPSPPRPKGIADVLRRPQRKPTSDDIERWASESGMGCGKLADALGDEPDGDEDVDVVGDEGEVAVEEAEEADRSLRGSVY
ncbi:hypothetical protein LTR36_007172 [Oleoguttula mirabilis]|uniref:Phosphoglycerate mutase-like protein n=1 Tax=Oleoguttula mirabilis TaxID=1507867 RepID=A0AAV9JA23_9PEZI|nr:hypothetical protein LTR36_007172 [Oleoguttula mirabilis]